MATASRLGPVALIALTIGGLVWFWLELEPQRLGFEDTDSPATSLAFLRGHAPVYAAAGLALLVAGLALIAGAIAIDDLLAPVADPVARRTVTTLGILAAACFILNGVLKLAVNPLLYIDGLDVSWGESGYVTIQLLGVHGFGQASILLLCSWIVGVATLGWRSRTIPLALVAVAAVAALRLVSLMGPFLASGIDGLWVLLIASIPAALLWPALLGIALLRRRRPAPTS
jgi:hypothetical protein